MSSKQATTWKAEPHTIAKIEMLRSYMYQWFSILGRRFKDKDLWYIDGFAGPGEYANYPHGSPLAALTSAESAISDAGAKWTAGKIHCVFMEDDASRMQHLEQKLEEVPGHPRIRRHVHRGSFADGFAWLGEQAENPFRRSEPVFAFIDPFGPSDMSFAVVRDLLSRPTSEVLVNLDSDGVNRIHRAGEHAGSKEILSDVFGDDSWQHELAGVRQKEAVLRIVALYKKKLRALPNVDYVFSFEMRGKNDVFGYHLVFASQHPRGLEKMKEVMKKIDQRGDYCFSDDHVGQARLFSFDDPTVAAQGLADHFHGRVVTYQDVATYALNESPFPNPKMMLRFLESLGRISVTCDASARRSKGTYPDALQGFIRIGFLS